MKSLWMILLAGGLLAAGPTLAGWSADSTVSKRPAPVSKQDYLDRTRAELNDLSTKVQDLQARSEKAGAETRIHLQQEVQVLQRKMAVARKKFDALSASTSTQWQKTRTNLDQAMTDLRTSYNKIAAKFK